MNDLEISVVVPMHDEEGNAMQLYEEIKESLDVYNKGYEIIFVNDFSNDDTLKVLEQIRGRDDNNFHYCDLEFNVGENWAVYAGVSKARGKVIVTIDGDIQNDPRFIPVLVNKINDGFKVVSGRREKRIGLIDRVIPSVVANKLISLVTGFSVHDTGCTLKAYRSDVIKNYYTPKGFNNRFSPVIYDIDPKDFTEVQVPDRVRLAGKSHYGLERIFIIMNDILVVPFIRKRNQESLENIRKKTIYFTIFIGLLLISGVLTGGFWPSSILIIIILPLLSVIWNLGRFIDCRENPKFVIKTFR
ncbi:MAG: glycosyltransferase [bacterium]|nr:glycosyltransferase [bacterium]